MKGNAIHEVPDARKVGEVMTTANATIATQSCLVMSRSTNKRMENTKAKNNAMARRENVISIQATAPSSGTTPLLRNTGLLTIDSERFANFGRRETRHRRRIRRGCHARPGDPSIHPTTIVSTKRGSEASGAVQMV